MRIRDSEGAVRIFYFTFTGKRIVLSHGFIKKTARTPLRELEIAEKRMNDFIDRQRGATVWGVNLKLDKHFVCILPQAFSLAH